MLYRHEVGRCSGCGQFVEQAGKDEILGSRIGPHLRSKAIYLRNVIGISYRKVPRAIEEFFGIAFTPAALLSFENVLGDRATPVVDDNANKLNERAKKAEIVWLKTELERLASCDVRHEKAVTLQGRILRHLSEWLVFVDDPRVPPTNNLAERALRPLVVLRKTSFGSRSKSSAQRMAKIMTIAETAKRHGHKPSDIFLGLYTRPPDKVMRELYANA
ncbi:IS66 family transposase [Pirellulaceae bacterium SH449]